MRVLLYALFVLSGAAGLIYETAWARSLGLVFGGSHLAVSTVLAVFMGGLALGGALGGRAADRSPNPLRLYGLLECGIALAAGGMQLLVWIYPSIYGPLARLGEGHPAFLTALRGLLSALAMIAPTTLMGATLPVLTRFVSSGPESVRRHLPLLYGLNTLGAVAGTLLGSFVLLGSLGVRATLGVAMATNLVVGAVALGLSRRAAPPGPLPATAAGVAAADAEVPAGAARLVLWGAGVSGFCALGYEVLWTRILTMTVGTTVYGFALILAVVLVGLALGSAAFGLFQRIAGARWGARRGLALFAAVEAAIGLAALGTTWLLGSLPEHSARLQGWLAGAGLEEFAARQTSTALLSLAYLTAPSLLLGFAFPLAGALRAALRRGVVGRAVGEVLASNTVGSVLGSLVTGFLLVGLLGIEQSLEVLVAVNVGFGLVLAGSLKGRAHALAALAAAAGLVAAMAAGAARGRVWDRSVFAVFGTSHRETVSSAADVKRRLELVDVLYYFEGINETIAVTKPKALYQLYVVNGRTEASTSPADMQVQRLLGHLPMLLHRDPKRVFVLGAGSGMTLGAVTLHPEAESITLAEIEPGALPATRAFGPYNHRALDHPKVKVVFADGRNFLATTERRFDVVTADPIHPWSGGAAYLYTAEYFRAAAARLERGGVMAQWLPLYELTPTDVATVVRTFAESFRHVQVWMTYYDAVLVGGDEPLHLDLAALDARLARSPAIAADLDAVGMGPAARDLAAYFLLGDAGARAFGARGVVNTDDNLWLEFSAPRSVGRFDVQVQNVHMLSFKRESLEPYVAPGSVPPFGDWHAFMIAGAKTDRVHELALDRGLRSPELAEALAAVRARFPEYRRAAFFGWLADLERARVPRRLESIALPVTGPDGPRRWVVSVVGVRLTERGAAVVLVDEDDGESLAEAFLETGPADLERALGACAQAFGEALRARPTAVPLPEAAAKLSTRELFRRPPAECASATPSR